MNKIVESDEEIRLQLEKSWISTNKVVSDNNVVERYELKYEDYNIKEIFEAKVEKKLGGLKEVNLSAKVAEAYNILMNPMFVYAYGDICYMVARKPDGRKSIELIEEQNRIDLIKNIIRGYNPEGRIYGIEALVRMSLKDKSILTKEDKDIIRTLKKMRIPVKTCSGCFAGDSNYKMILKGFQTQNSIPPNIHHSQSNVDLKDLFHKKTIISSEKIDWEDTDISTIIEGYESLYVADIDIFPLLSIKEALNTKEPLSTIMIDLEDLDQSSKKVKVIESNTFDNKVKDRILYEPWEMDKYLKMSDLLIINEELVGIKCDYAGFKKNNGHCDIRYYFFIRNNEKWEILYTLGDHCLFC